MRARAGTRVTTQYWGRSLWLRDLVRSPSPDTPFRLCDLILPSVEKIEKLTGTAAQRDILRWAHDEGGRAKWRSDPPRAQLDGRDRLRLTR